jgi:hypothetical protein
VVGSGVEIDDGIAVEHEHEIANDGIPVNDGLSSGSGSGSSWKTSWYRC